LIDVLSHPQARSEFGTFPIKGIIVILCGYPLEFVNPVIKQIFAVLSINTTLNSVVALAVPIPGRRTGQTIRIRYTGLACQGIFKICKWTSYHIGGTPFRYRTMITNPSVVVVFCFGTNELIIKERIFEDGAVIVPIGADINDVDTSTGPSSRRASRRATQR